MTTEIDAAKYIAFGTYKKDGSLVSTPTWVTPFENGYAFTTDTGSFKVKRIQRRADVVVSVSDVRGRVSTGRAVLPGTAEVLDNARALRVRELIKKKYRVGWYLTIAPRNVWNRLRGRESSMGAGAIKFVLSQS